MQNNHAHRCLLLNTWIPTLLVFYCAQVAQTVLRLQWMPYYLYSNGRHWENTTICRGIVLQYPTQIQKNLSQPSLKKYHHYDNLIFTMTLAE